MDRLPPASISLVPGRLTMKFHPYSEVFPLLNGADFDALVEDITRHGLREPLWIYKGQILDGRNRFLACQKARVKPATRKFTGDDDAALAHVVSANVHRRHMDASQRAMAAARISTLRLGANQHSEGVPIGTGSGLINASERSTKRARKVLEKGSESLIRAVDSGEIPVSRAAVVVDLPKREQLAAATKKHESDELENWTPDDDEDKRLTAIEREQESSLQKWLDADDKLAAAHAEIKRLAAEVAVLKISRDGFQNRCGEQARIIKSLRNRLAKLEKSAA